MIPTILPMLAMIWYSHTRTPGASQASPPATLYHDSLKLVPNKVTSNSDQYAGSLQAFILWRSRASGQRAPESRFIIILFINIVLLERFSKSTDFDDHKSDSAAFSVHD